MAEPETSPPPTTSDSTALTTTTSGAVAKKKKIIKVKKRRPARPQVDPATFKTPQAPATGTSYNIWYNKWSGSGSTDGFGNSTPQHAAGGRCNIALDSGYTKADATPGSYFCLFFARGICPRGKDCEYLHRLPDVSSIFNPNVDCFGRDKFSDYRDDMGGVGTFMRHNRTLYIGRVFVSDDVEEIVARHFNEWGDVERLRVLNNRGVAFVTYANLANAEFAKEAMAHQPLDHEEVLNVRWATMDPNPQAAKREAKKIEEQAAEAIRRALPPEYVAELEGRTDDSKKRRKIEGSFGLEGYDAPDEVWFEKEKTEWMAQQRGLGAGSDQHMLENDERLLIDGGAGAEQPTAPVEEYDEGGIISGSTLAALKNRKQGPSGLVTAKKSSEGGPLVGYGSDSDAD
jgi:hypothetical protein